MEINYLGTFSYLEEIQIDNLGDFALECVNDAGHYYYMVVKTFQGVVSIFTWGPLVPDVDLLPSIKGKAEAYSFKLSRMKWNEKKITNAIWSFLNNADRKISFAKIITDKEAIEQIKDMKFYISNFGEDYN